MPFQFERRRKRRQTSKLGFGPGSMKKELARGAKHMAGLLVGHKVVRVKWADAWTRPYRLRRRF